MNMVSGLSWVFPIQSSLGLCSWPSKINNCTLIHDEEYPRRTSEEFHCIWAIFTAQTGRMPPQTASLQHFQPLSAARCSHRPCRRAAWHHKRVACPLVSPNLDLDSDSWPHAPADGSHEHSDAPSAIYGKSQNRQKEIWKLLADFAYKRGIFPRS